MFIETRPPALLLALLALSVSAACSPADAPEPASPVTVSGVSSGAYMAVQVQVAFADRVRGVAAIAGGPYHCARGNLVTALGPCLSGAGIDVDALVARARQRAAAGDIADPSQQPPASVWIFHGEADEVVDPRAGLALADFYRAWAPGSRLRIVDDLPAGHGWPTDGEGVACGDTASPFINDCGYDAAGEMLAFFYGTLDAPDPARGSLEQVDIGQLAGPGTGIDRRAFLFMPDDCRSQAAGCRLHIAFHGCRQGGEFLGDEFARRSGLNAWAATNRTVVLYPQVTASLTNPQGCWDWWGYTGPSYDLASGRQVAAVARMMTAHRRGGLGASDSQE